MHSHKCGLCWRGEGKSPLGPCWSPTKLDICSISPKKPITNLEFWARFACQKQEKWIFNKEIFFAYLEERRERVYWHWSRSARRILGNRWTLAKNRSTSQWKNPNEFLQITRTIGIAFICNEIMVHSIIDFTLKHQRVHWITDKSYYRRYQDHVSEFVMLWLFMYCLFFFCN